MLRYGKPPTKTIEGRQAWMEAFKSLNGQPESPALKWSDKLASAALAHCNDIGPKGMASHVGSDFSSLKNRVERVGISSKRLAESIMFGKNTGPDYIYQLYVDDGVETRIDRYNMVNPDFKWTGIAHCLHAK